MEVDDPWGEQLSKRAKTGDESEAHGVVVTITSEGLSIQGQGIGEVGSTSREPVVTVEYLTSALLTSTESSHTSTTAGPLDKSPSLFSQYMDIKRKNQDIKKEIYPQAWGENMAQTKVLYVVDYQQGTFNLAILEPKGPTTHSPADYKATQMKMKLGDVHLVDMVELHKKTSDMLYRGVLQSLPVYKKMQNMVVKIDKQLKQEKLATKAKQIQITELEKKIVALSADPKNLLL
jgi:hypothetical protein